MKKIVSMKVAVVNSKVQGFKNGGTKTNAYVKSWSGRYFHIESKDTVMAMANRGDNLTITGFFTKDKFICETAELVEVKPKKATQPAEPQDVAVA